jgi:hypothetical protein
VNPWLILVFLAAGYVLVAVWTAGAQYAAWCCDPDARGDGAGVGLTRWQFVLIPAVAWPAYLRTLLAILRLCAKVN